MKLYGRIASTCLAGFLTAMTSMAQDFKPYPGSKLEEDASRRASSARVTCRVYTSDDAFERLYVFYKQLYPEFQWRLPRPKLPSGEEVQWAYFILDGAKDLA